MWPIVNSQHVENCEIQIMKERDFRKNDEARRGYSQNCLRGDKEAKLAARQAEFSLLLPSGRERN